MALPWLWCPVEKGSWWSAFFLMVRASRKQNHTPNPMRPKKHFIFCEICRTWISQNWQIRDATVLESYLNLWQILTELIWYDTQYVFVNFQAFKKGSYGCTCDTGVVCETFLTSSFLPGGLALICSSAAVERTQVGNFGKCTSKVDRCFTKYVRQCLLCEIQDLFQVNLTLRKFLYAINVFRS